MIRGAERCHEACLYIHTRTCTVSTQTDVQAFSPAAPEEFLTSALLFGLWSVGAALYHIPPYLYLCAGMSLSGSHTLPLNEASSYPTQ